MTDTDKARLKEKMLSELERVQNEITRLEEITRPVKAEDMDDITRMDSIVNKSVNESALSTARAKRAGLEYSLKRISDPEFGYCLDCGEAIAFARLMAMPESAQCIECAR